MQARFLIRDREERFPDLFEVDGVSSAVTTSTAVLEIFGSAVSVAFRVRDGLSPLANATGHDVGAVPSLVHVSGQNYGQASAAEQRQ